MDKKEVIREFRGEYEFLSNFFDCLVDYNGNKFDNSEAAFQSAKSTNKQDVVDFVCGGKYSAPSKAKSAGKKVALREDWEQVKDGIMLDVLRCKFDDPELGCMLMSTDGATLVEGNTWGDTYWGVCKGVGKNMLGTLLMQVRDELVDKYIHNPRDENLKKQADSIVESIIPQIGNCNNDTEWRYMFSNIFEAFRKYTLYIIGLSEDYAKFDNKIAFASTMLRYKSVSNIVVDKNRDSLFELCAMLDSNQVTNDFNFFVSCLEVLDSVRNASECCSGDN